MVWTARGSAGCDMREGRAASKEITERFLFKREGREGLPARRIPCCQGPRPAAASPELSVVPSREKGPGESFGVWIGRGAGEELLSKGEQRLAESYLGHTLRIRDSNYVAL